MTSRDVRHPRMSDAAEGRIRNGMTFLRPKVALENGTPFFLVYFVVKMQKCLKILGNPKNTRKSLKILRTGMHFFPPEQKMILERELQQSRFLPSMRSSGRRKAARTK